MTWWIPAEIETEIVEVDSSRKHKEMQTQMNTALGR